MSYKDVMRTLTKGALATQEEMLEVGQKKEAFPLVFLRKYPIRKTGLHLSLMMLRYL